MTATGGETTRELADRLLAQQRVLLQVAREIGPADELAPVLRTVLAAMRSLVEFRGGTICLVDDAGVFVAAADPAVSESVARARVPIGTGLAGRVVRGGVTIYSPDIRADERVDQSLAATGSNEAMRSYLAAPLVCLGQVIGLLQVDSAETDAFDADDTLLLEGLATQVAGAIESARRFEDMRQLAAARSTFIARVSHELRTPLTILQGFTSLMLHNSAHYGVEGEALDLLERVDVATGRLRLLVEKLVTATSLDLGLRRPPEAEELAVTDVLAEVVARSQSPGAITISCPPELIANVDRRLLGHILDLLVENALIYAGAAELEAAGDDRGERTIRVVDHGPGIADERKPIVFERFQRGDHAGSGWGLGLSTAVELADTIGATVTLTDTPGGGATFVLTLPAR